MHRESLWDEQSRAEAIGLAMVEKQTCPRCGNPLAPVEVEWSERSRPGDEASQPVSGARKTFTASADRFGGRKDRSVIQRMRCNSCAALELVRRNAADAEPDVKPGKAHPSDGAWFVAEPYHPEP